MIMQCLSTVLSDEIQLERVIITESADDLGHNRWLRRHRAGPLFSMNTGLDCLLQTKHHAVV